jgi:hypothetical protein
MHIALAFREDRDVRKYPHSTLRMPAPLRAVKTPTPVILPQSGGSGAKGKWREAFFIPDGRPVSGFNRFQALTGSFVSVASFVSTKAGRSRGGLAFDAQITHKNGSGRTGMQRRPVGAIFLCRCCPDVAAGAAFSSPCRGQRRRVRRTGLLSELII